VGDTRRSGEDEFRAFVVARQPALLRAAYLLTGDRYAAEDLVQRALAEAAYRWPKLSTGQPEAYVRRVIYTRFCSGLRRRKVLVEASVADTPDRPSPDLTESVDQRVGLERALASLAPRQRACVVLRFYEDRSAAETAAVLGCSVGAVKSQTHDALNRLRAIAPELSGLLPEVADHDVTEVAR
jgi:RNA polymerase sigma-70 factor (sigma-E family)